MYANKPLLFIRLCFFHRDVLDLQKESLCQHYMWKTCRKICMRP